MGNEKLKRDQILEQLLNELTIKTVRSKTEYNIGWFDQG